MRITKLDWQALVILACVFLVTAFSMAWMLVSAWAREPEVQVSDVQMQIAVTALERGK